MQGLFELANCCQVTAHRDAMFKGEEINTTEGRAVLHTALRNFSDQPKLVKGIDVMPEVRSTLEKMRIFTDAVHSGKHKGYTQKNIKNVVAIGIGGSFLGPKIMSEALKPYQSDAITVHYVANVDGSHIRGRIVVFRS